MLTDVTSGALSSVLKVEHYRNILFGYCLYLLGRTVSKYFVLVLSIAANIDLLDILHFNRSETIEMVLCESLFPGDFSVRDKVKNWVKVFSGFDKFEVKALEKIMEQKQRFVLNA